MHKAREYIKGRLLMRMEDSRAVASWLASQELLMDEITTPDETAASIDAVDPRRRPARRPGGLVDAGRVFDWL